MQQLGKWQKTFKSSGGAFNLQFLKHGTLLQAGFSIYTLQGEEMESRFSSSNGAQVSVADESHLLAVGGDRTVNLWNTSPLRKIKQIDIGSPSGRVVTALSRDGHWLVTGYEEDINTSVNAIQIYDLVADRVTTSILLPEEVSNVSG